ncbi:MAG TPA: PIG-L family deacetylase [Gemmatimonadales bacterium]|nr:PIG-L family deacetylase [Gemmatimonadales bacterium]
MRIRSAATALAAALLMCANPLHGQLGPPSTGGAVAAEHARRMLGHNKRVLVIGAHPDDEDTGLITVLVRGEGAEAAYLSLNRGEGGQNLIGPELGEALGLLRTEELLSARSLDGGRQYFTRAYDFGYSKTLDDTWQHWLRDSILKDVVRVIRQFQPQIIVSVFSGTPEDGHGQHQAAGWAAQAGFEAAADPSRFPELAREEGLPAWRAAKLYRGARFTPVPNMFTIQTGGLDPAVGQSYHQIAMASRSRHRSQDMGALQTPGPASTRIALVTDRTGAGDTLWAGVDTTLPAPFVTGPLELRLARLNFAAGAASRPQPWPANWEDQARSLETALANERGLVLDAVASVADLVPGQSVEVTLTLWNAGWEPVHAALAITGATTGPARPSVPVAPGELLTVTDTVRLPPAATTEPYFLRLPRDGAMYRWGNSPDAGRPASAPLLTAVAMLDNGLRLSREVTYRWRDPAYGERRERLLVVPRVGVRLDRSMLVWPLESRDPRTVTVTLSHASSDTTSGAVQLEVPAGWAAPPAQPFRLTRKGEEASFRFVLSPPDSPTAGAFEIRAVAVASDGARYDEASQTIAYPHIARRAMSRPAVGTIRIMDIAVPSLRAVGYVRGPADGVPEALAGLGIPVVELTPDSLARGDLSRFDAVVIGSRAYETVSAVQEFNSRLLAYARAGGLLLVQYQQYEFFGGSFAPFPMTLGGQSLGSFLSGKATMPKPGERPDSHDRVTDQGTPVRIVDPSSPVVRAPNAIGPDDWQGWVQERGLYFARSWAPEYRPVLEMHDPGEPALRGGLLVAPVGQGTYVYTGIAFFRELPAGVPGAYRLFMNLLALQPAGEHP